MTRALDLRRIIAYLFLVYGAILTIMGAFASPGALTKAENIRINLWTGLGMLAVGVIFLAWELARPLETGPTESEAPPEDPNTPPEDPNARPR